MSRPLWLLLIAAAAAMTAPPSPIDLVGQADAKKRKRLCSARSHPQGCIKVPPGTRRDRRVKPQDEPAVAPEGFVNGGGVGGGEGRREDGARDWASGFTDSDAWAHRDERFVEQAYAVTKSGGAYPSARVLRRHLRLRLGTPKNAPAGTLMLFESDAVNRHLGHVGLSLGDGRMLSAVKTVRVTDVTLTRYWREAYLGWSRAPSAWPGRLPVPFELVGAVSDASARILSPISDAPVAGIVSLTAVAPLGTSLEFAAYYSEDPAHADPTWHSLGRTTAIGEMHTLPWNTATVPDQGDPKTGIVTIAAITVGADGIRQDVAEYVRVNVHNGS